MTVPTSAADSAWALAVIATAQWMVVLDATIISFALLHIHSALGFFRLRPGVMVNGYSLVFGGLHERCRRGSLSSVAEYDIAQVRSLIAADPA